MYAFGMLGSYFSQGVYAVAGPFQGAVDIIVVQQEDGSYKSSPWYVKCGDFQGVLKRREKIVDISVNDVPANFYMLLNSRGEAYFEKEVDDAVLALPCTLSSGKGLDETIKLEGVGSSKAVATEQDSQVECASTADGNGSTCPGNSIDQSKVQQDDLLSKTAPESQEPCSVVDPSSNSSIDQSSMNLVDQSSGFQEGEDIHCARRHSTSSTDASHMNTAELSDSVLLVTEDTFELQPSDSDVAVKCMDVNVTSGNQVLADSILPKNLADEERLHMLQVQTGDKGYLPVDDEGCLPVDDEALNTDTRTDGPGLCNLNTVITEDWFGLPKASSFESGDAATSIANNLDTFNTKAMDELIWNDFKIVTAAEEEELHNALCNTPVIGVHIDGNSLTPDVEDEKNSELVDSSVWVSDTLVDDATRNLAIAMTEGSIPMQASDEDASMEGVTSDKNVVCNVEEGPPRTEGEKTAGIPTIAVVPPPSRWTMWPLSLRRSKAEKAHMSEAADTKQALLAATNIALESPLTEVILRQNGYHEWTQKPKLRSYVPTSSQIESLKLKDGPNKVTFTFPRVLGRTQVDANIYLWKWKTRIVISDVDGTITKSDVLGQFMPLVGRDWSQSGVTRLFSAIKENGYEVLFLSARAISQAYLTRQFLINLKQDGETLPEGPVFISPDGLIPSLYREVVRRAPHEFKISCLEGIRRLFPNDVNPFYAGFGNRDTDEISYLKVGIPKGKIFIINPKGEVMVNHHVDAKSYTSIHALVDDMFPPIYSSEQEAFNTWNYWKLPLPDFVDELSTTSTKAKKGGASKK